MSTENTVSPGEETQNQAPEVAEETPEVAAPEAEAEAVAEEAAPEDEADKTLKRLQRRIDKRTADVYRERARADELARRIEALEAKTVPDEPSPDIQGRTTEHLAEEISLRREFAKEAKVIVEGGREEFEDFEPTLKELVSEIGPLVDDKGLPTKFMRVLREVEEDPAQQRKILYHLGKNPDLAEELSGLSEIKLAKRLDRIEREMADKSKPKPGTAPKPLPPVKPSAANSSLPRDDDSADEWMRKERARMKAKGLTYG